MSNMNISRVKSNVKLTFPIVPVVLEVAPQVNLGRDSFSLVRLVNLVHLDEVGKLTSGKPKAAKRTFLE